MKLSNYALAVGLAAFVAAPAQAKQGAPHSVQVSANFGSVTLSWQAPKDTKQLKWHNGSAYNGDDGRINDAQKPLVKFYAGALFTADDLKPNVGEKIQAISFYQYRPVVKATVLVYANDEVVAQAVADPALFVKDKMLDVALPEGVVIKPDTDYRFAVCYEAGSNMDMVAIKDNASTPGKGDWLSYDGKNWFITGNGDYMIGAILANDADEEPVAYAVNCDGKAVADLVPSNTSHVLADQPAGTHTYSVTATYEDGNKVTSYVHECEVADAATTLSAPNWDTYKITDLTANLKWTAPLAGGNSLAWDSSKEMALNIGGTATTNTKVWIRNQFDANDLLSFQGGSFQKVRAYFAEPVTSVTVWVQVDGVLTDYKAYADAISEAGWYEFALNEPVKIESGKAISYGLYVLHPSKGHPIAVGKSTTVDVKGNSFSTSSPNSTNFLKSNPSFKTLRSGGMEGNWMMEAVVENAPAAQGPYTYDIYRDGALLKEGITALEYDDEVTDLGTYTYIIKARDAQGKTSFGKTLRLTYKLPSAYEAPVIVGSNFDEETNVASLEWTTDKQLAKYGTPSYMVGFDEDMDMMWGVQFSASELAAYQGYKINKLKAIIGEEVGDLTIGVYTTKGVALSELTIPANTLEALGLYTINLPKAVEIDGTQDLVIAYKANVKGGLEPIVLDAGPLVEGGARISLTGGLTWMNIGTVNPTYNNYNIVMAALATADAAANAPAKVLGASIDELEAITVNVAARTEEISALVIDAPAAPAKAAASKPVVKHFNIYRNNEKIAETTTNEFQEQIPGYGVFTYFVTAEFTNGWESAASTTLTARRQIAQKAAAPYALTAQSQGKDLQLSWQKPEDAVQLTYAKSDKVGGVGMTGTNPTSHVANKFPADVLTNYVGYTIDHIQFGLYTNEVNSLSVIVMYGENIIYKQAVPVETLVSGVNDVRLSNPVVIPANTDVCIGYVTQYKTGLKPLGLTENVADAELGDLISSSAGAGYWYSLKNKFKVDFNFWIKGILSAPATEIKAQEADATTYNVYCNGTKIASNVAQCSHVVTEAATGTYHVTAVDAAGNESGESNAVHFGAAGVDNISVDAVNAPAEFYRIDGVRVAEPAPGTVVIRRQNGKVDKQLVK